MSHAEALAAAIRRIEPRLTSLVKRERAPDQVNSLRVAVLAGLTTSALAVLNLVDMPNLRLVADELVEKVGKFAGNDVVRIDEVILDPSVRAEARNQIMGAGNTNAATAFALAYNLCGPKDLQQMLSLNRGPLGPVGGIAAILCQRLLPKDKASNLMMESVEIVGELMEALKAPEPAPSSRAAQSSGQGCAIAALAVLTGGAGALAGAAALVQHIFST